MKHAHFVGARLAAMVVAGAALLLSAGAAESLNETSWRGDWPMWRYDADRTAASPHELSHDLSLHWVRELPAPKRAWPQQQDDGDKLAFDVSYEPVAYGGLLFVPSMVRDRVTAYDLRTGEEEWRFYADGPIRFAPAAADGRVYAASDDGRLYCLNAAMGELLWKHRGGPSKRTVLGNGRLIDTWPARGGPAIRDGVVYYAAGVWPSMGVFLHALDAETGAVVWTNSTSGSAFVDQPHAGGSFSGAAPQGYVVATEDRVIAPNGRSRPAGYRRDTGEFLYLDVGSRPFGRGWGGQGGYAVMAKGGYFHVTGEAGRVSDGELMLQIRTPALAETLVQRGREAELERWPLIDVAVANDEALLGVADGKLMAHAHEPASEMQESEPCRRGRTADYYPLRELWTVGLDAQVERVFIQAGNRLYGEGPDGEVLAIDVPDGEDTARVSRIGEVEGEIWNMLAADGRLIVVTTEGRLYGFGPGEQAVTEFALEERPRVLEGDDVWAERIEAMLDGADAVNGYALLIGMRDGAALTELLDQSDLDIVVFEADTDKAEQLRRDLDEAGLYGERVTVRADSLTAAALPPYLAQLAVVGDAAWMEADDACVEQVFRSLRPYGGSAWLLLSGEEHQDTLEEWVREADLTNAELDHADGMTRLTRAGSLHGAGSWTHQNANAANTVVSRDNLREPLGLLWFGGPSNENVLPRHGRGPIPHVVGGRLFILGPDTLSARDLYTGRLQWEKSLPGIGLPYDTTSHQPGADHVGAPYVSLEDGIYVRRGDVIMRLEPATGETLAEFALPTGDDEDEAGPWEYAGYIAVWEDLLIAGLDAQFFDDSRPGNNTSWNATSSGRLAVLDRHTGEILWSREAEHGFRHNAIAAGGGRLYVMDRLTDGALNLLERRGQEADRPSLLAIDIRGGGVLWRDDETTFGTWLGYSEPHDMLLQAGRPARDRRQGLEDEPFPGERLAAYCASSGEALWERAAEYHNAPMLHDETIIVSGAMFDLLTGEDRLRPHPLTGEGIPWRFPSASNCAQLIASENLVSFRRGTASYYDLAGDGGVADIGGFRAGCTPNLVAAGGVLSAPDYTRTCICAYPLQTSLALVHDPGVETWTSYAGDLPAAEIPIQRAGVNFGAPGDRRCESGTLWLAHPEIGALRGESSETPLLSGGRGGTAPDALPVAVTPEHPGWLRFHRHSSLLETAGRDWVYASGISGAESIRMTLVPEEANAEVRYTVRLFFAEPDSLEPGQRRFSVRLQDEDALRDFDIAAEADAPNAGVMREFNGVAIANELRIGLAAANNSDYPPILNGVEVIRED